MPTGDDQSYLAGEQRAGLNLVFVDRPPRLLRADTVLSDNVKGAYDGVAHLLAHGHTRIAFLGDLEEIPTATERFAGYRQALTEAGIALERELVVFGIHGADAAETGVGALLDGARPTALFTAQNLITIGAVRGLRNLGLRHQIAVVGFDDFALLDLLEPPVTIVAQDPWAIGAAACQRLFERMDGDGGPPSRWSSPRNSWREGPGRSVRTEACRGTAQASRTRAPAPPICAARPCFARRRHGRSLRAKRLSGKLIPSDLAQGRIHTGVAVGAKREVVG